MIEITLLLVVNLVLLFVVIYYLKKSALRNWLDLKKHILLLMLGWMALSVLIGLLICFNELEASQKQSIAELRKGAQIALQWMAPGLSISSFILFLAAGKRAN
jgi:protein-S-isoprenylcysteine O-methyltransferase Ste14